MLSRDEINIGYLSTIYHTSLILMGRNWIENRLNLKVNWKLFGSGPDIVESFRKKEVDIGYIGLPPVIIGIDKGVPIKCVAGGHVEGTLMIAKNRFRSLEELSGSMSSVLQQFTGKVIGVPQRGSIHDVIIRNTMKEAGFEDEITVKNFDWADLIPEAMLAGEIDAAVGTPPLAVVCARSCKTKAIIPPDKLWPNNPSYGITVTKKLIREDSKLIKEFLKLHEEASNLIQTAPSEAAKIVSHEVGIIDEDFVLETYKISPKYCAALSDEFIRSTLSFIPVLYELRYIKKMLTEDEIFDTTMIGV